MGYWLVVWQDVFTTILFNSYRQVPYHASEVVLLKKEKYKKLVLGARAVRRGEYYSSIRRGGLHTDSFTLLAAAIIGAGSIGLHQIVEWKGLHQKRFKNQYQFLQRHLIPDNYRNGSVSKS